jgi:lipopolysaccharide transport system ATP-binding protein
LSDVAVHIENLGKLYRIGERQRYATLRDALMHKVTAPLRLLSNGRGGTAKDGCTRSVATMETAKRGPQGQFIWALRHIALEIKRGEVVGIIGRNGAGKSTLLKILSRITEPTEGEVRIYGGVGSLLEVGTGFHPELTGRENIYLNGAILGMKKTEIDNRFDEIAEFAELEQFLETPVKRYSSGMYMRLAFSVAAHLQPEILIVDEVLAVGDAAFQKKCLGKIGEVAREGRTVLFVSHNMAAVENLCERTVFLEAGEVVVDGAPRKAIAEYFHRFAASARPGSLLAARRDRGLVPVIQDVEFIDEAGRRVTAVPAGAPLTVRIHYRHSAHIKRPFFGLIFETASGVKVFWVQSRLQSEDLPDLPQAGVVVCRIPRLPLVPGTYFIQPGCGAGTTQLDLVPRACQLQVTEADVFGTGRLPNASQGLVLVDAWWGVPPDDAIVQSKEEQA